MNNNKKELPEGYETPLVFVFGVLCLVVSVVPGCIGFIDGNKAAIIACIFLFLSGSILMIAGRIQSIKRIKKLTKT